MGDFTPTECLGVAATRCPPSQAELGVMRGSTSCHRGRCLMQRNHTPSPVGELVAPAAEMRDLFGAIECPGLAHEALHPAPVFEFNVPDTQW